MLDRHPLVFSHIRAARVILLPTLVLTLALVAVAGLGGSAQTAPPAGGQTPAKEPQLGGGKPIFPQNQGGPNFQKYCAACHTAEGMDIGGRIALPLNTLRTLTAERVYAAMSVGTMVAQAAPLSDPLKRELAAFVSGKRFTDTSAYAVENMPNRCGANAPLGELSAAPAWNGWSPTANNARFQPAGAAGIRAADVPRLRVKWAFGFPGGASGTSQPTIALGRVFVGSDNGFLYSLDARTGCGYWSVGPDAGGPYAPLVGPISGHGSAKYAVYGVTRSLTAFAVDAQDGKELWRTKITGGGGIRGAAALADGRIYVPITGTETMVGAAGANCCKTRGAVVSIDANTGQVVWRADSIQEPLRQVGTRKDGTPVMGPSGASVWNTPTVDLKRRRIYVGTGNSFGPVPASTSDSVLALNMDDGKIVWHHQEFSNDAFMLNCPEKNPDGGNCPSALGPDWDFGGSSIIMQTLPNGEDILVAAGKGGVAIALDVNGKVLWRTKLYDTVPPTADGLVLFGGTSDGTRVYYALQQPKGGLAALQLRDGTLDWNMKLNADGRGQFGAATGIPGIVFTGGWDGVLRAIDGKGKTVWRFNSKQPFKTVNGVGADGGSFGSAGPTVANGMVFAVSGYIGMQAGAPGNVLLAFAVQ